MKKRILEVLEDHRGFEDLEYVAGLIEHVIKEKTNGEKIAEFTPEGVDYSKLSDESTRLSGIEYSEFANLSFGDNEITHDGDGKELDKPLGERRVKSYGFFKNEYYDD